MRNEKVVKKLSVLLSIILLLGTMGGLTLPLAGAEGDPAEITLWRSIGRFTPEERYEVVPYESTYGVLEEMFNVRFKFTDVPQESVNEQMNILVSTDALPDIVYSWSAMDKTFIDPALLYANGQVIALDDVAEYIPNYLSVLETYPAMQKSVKNEEGKLLCFTEQNIYLESAFSGGPMIRKDWLDKLGMDVPDTYEDWLAAFEGIKNGDMNGNGDPDDEVPYVGSEGTLRVLANTMGCPDEFFMLGGPTGEVVYGPILPEYKQRLEFMTEIVSKGYINEDYLNFMGESRDQLFANDQAASTFTGTSNLDRWNLQQAMAGNAEFMLVAAPYPKGPDGNRYFDRGAITKSITDTTITISAKSRYQTLCAQICDYFYSEEGILLNIFGVEGVTYNLVDGFPVYSDLIMKNAEGLTPFDAREKYVGISGVPRPVDIRDVAQLSLATPLSREAVVHTWTDVFDINTNTPIPPAIMEEADAQEFADIMGDIKTYVDTSTQQFIQGKLNLESDFDTFQANVKNMGIDRALELQQKAVKQWQERGGAYVYNMERADINWDALLMSSDIGKDLVDPDLLSALAQ